MDDTYFDLGDFGAPPPPSMEMPTAMGLFWTGDLSSLGHDPILAPVWHDVLNPTARFEYQREE